MATLEDKLRARYGGARFNPSAGQKFMSYQEWMDRHPSLARMPEDATRARYDKAVSTDGGVDWSDYNPDAPEMYTSGRAVLDDEGKLQASTASLPAAGDDLRDGLPGPDAPPPGALRAAHRRQGGRGISSKRTMMPPGRRRGRGGKPPVMGANWLKKPGARGRIADMVRKGEVRLPTPKPRPAPFNPQNAKPAPKPKQKPKQKDVY